MTAENPMHAAKSAVRAEARAARAAIAPDDRAFAAIALSERLLALPEFTDACVVLGYGATAEEIDPAPALTALANRGITIALPRIEAPGELSLRVIGPDTHLEAGPYGLTQPPASAVELDPLEIDVAIVPGCAFDAEGCRLGFGGGFYDRLLPKMRPDATAIAVAFDEQVLPQVPAEEHDAFVDLVVTPTRVLGRI